MSRLIKPTAATSALTAVLAVSLAACGSSGSDDSSSSGSASKSGGSASGNAAPVSNGASQIHVTLTGSGGKDVCQVDHTTAKAGPVTITVENKDSSAINELELISDQRILGEKENLAPGLAPAKFTLTLGGGSYDLYCPGASPETQKLTVTGKAAAAPSGSTQTLLNSGTKQYASYVTTTIGDMQTAVKNLKDAVDRGDVADAKKKYALARPFYERIESDVDGFVLPGFKPGDNKGNLDYLIDMRASNLDPKVGWHGFHAVERDLWKNGKITPDTKKLVDELNTNVGKLKKLSGGLTYRPEDLANGAASLLEEVQTEKIKGEEEAFSHLDLVDFNANVEGAQQAFAMLKPGLQKIDPTLTKSIADQFTAVNKSLDKYRDPQQPGGFKAWTPELRKTDAAALSKTVQGLQDPLSHVGEKVATAK